MPLTALSIKNLKPKTKAYKVADGGGLFLFVSPSGGKLWRWKYRFDGKEQALLRDDDLWYSTVNTGVFISSHF